MKLGLMKRIIATGLCAAMLFGDVLPVVAMGSVSGGDAVVIEEESTALAEKPQVVSEVDTAPVEETVSDEEVAQVEETVLDEETVSDGDAIVALEPVIVDGVTITVSGPASAFAEGTTVSAVEVDPAEVVIAAAEENEQATVKKYKAFDINLVCNGEVVQPLNGAEIKVNFEGDMLIPDAENNEDVAVYHVDEEDNVTKMEAEVAPLESIDAETKEVIEETVEVAETVEMTTTHFSTYVVVITSGQTEFEVTYRHFADVNSDNTYEEFYMPFTDTVKANTTKTYTDFEKAGKTAGGKDYTVASIVIDYEDDDMEDITISATAANPAEVNVEIKSNATINIYYAPVIQNTDGNRYENNAIFYDYYLYDNDTKIGINSPLVRGEVESGRYLAMGEYDNRPDGKQWDLYIEDPDGDTVDANEFQGGNGKKIIVRGIVDSLYGNNYSQINWGENTEGETIQEPGYFDMTDKKNGDIWERKVYYNDKDENPNTYYNLTFDKTGSRYQLYSAKVNDGNGETETLSERGNSKDFFPLDNVNDLMKGTNHSQIDNHSGQNSYFGIRYDFSFTLGEYIGPLEYTFVGDDDLWVFVNGELVLDLGGVHSAYPTAYMSQMNESGILNTVDIWDKYFGVSKEERTGNWWENIEELAYRDPMDPTKSKYDSTKTYQVTVLYMERGSYDSTCYMDFTLPNITPRTVTQNYGKLSFVKQDSLTGEAVSGAGFTLYSDEACTTAIRSVVSDHNGKVLFDNLTAGEYYLKEITAPEGYVSTDKVWKVEVTEETVNNVTTVNVKMFDGSVELTTGVITNEPIIDPIDVEFTKVDFYNNNKILPGATFTLSDEDGQVLQTKTSDANGKVKFTELEEGVYIIEETEAPEGYVLSDSKWTLTVTLNRAEKKLEYTTDVPNKVLTNEPYVDFEFTKVNSETDEVLGDVEFTLYEGLSDSRNVTVATATSDANGIVKFEGLRVDQDYLLVETETPYGYVEPATPWVIRVDYENGNFVQKIFAPTLDGGNWTYDSSSVVSSNIVENDPAYGSLKITKKVDKIDLAYGAPSFTFKIVGPKGVYYGVITFDDANVKEKTIEIKDLPVGNYTVTEMNSLQYTLTSADTGSKEVTGNVNIPEFKFVNELDGDGYSHSDVVVNSFRRNADGSIDISKNREVID